jgi:hypothetical protein
LHVQRDQPWLTPVRPDADFLAIALLQILDDLDVVAADVNHVVGAFLDVAPDDDAGPWSGARDRLG